MPGPLFGLRKATSIGPDPNPPGHPEDDYLGTAIQGLLGAASGGLLGDDTSQANRGGQMVTAGLPFSRFRRAGPDAVEALMKTLVGVNPAPEEEAAGLAAKKFFGEAAGKQHLPGGRLESRLESYDNRINRPDTVLTRPSLRELQVMDWNESVPKAPAPGMWRGKGGRDVTSMPNRVKSNQTARPGSWGQSSPGYESKYSSALTGEDKKVKNIIYREDQAKSASATRARKKVEAANKP